MPELLAVIFVASILGIVAIRDQEVVEADVDRVIDAARAVAIPADQKILHILPQEFVIDARWYPWPVGMSGVRLEAKVHMVTGAVSAAQNIIKCVRRCGLEVEDIILEQLASSYSVLTDDEKELVFVWLILVVEQLTWRSIPMVRFAILR